MGGSWRSSWLLKCVGFCWKRTHPASWLLLLAARPATRFACDALNRASAGWAGAVWVLSSAVHTGGTPGHALRAAVTFCSPEVSPGSCLLCHSLCAGALASCSSESSPCSQTGKEGDARACLPASCSGSSITALLEQKQDPGIPLPTT